MTDAHMALAKTDDLPIKHEGGVHDGKVRSVYWLTEQDSFRLIGQKEYDLQPWMRLGVMVISDRISAFDVNWKAEGGLDGVPGKGAALNAISNYWFRRFAEAGLPAHHIVDAPHPLVWVVQQARPTVMVEAIARQYITGSMWEAYNKRGEREFCGIQLPNDLEKNQRLDGLLITPTTKGTLSIPGLPAGEDANLTRAQIFGSYRELGFKSPEDVRLYERALVDGFGLISMRLAELSKLFVDTKFEFGYLFDARERTLRLGFIDEVGTPDSSRIWDAAEHMLDPESVTEWSKEGFRQFLLHTLDVAVLRNGSKEEKRTLAGGYRVPAEQFLKVAETYRTIAEQITGEPVPTVERPREEISDVLSDLKLVA